MNDKHMKDYKKVSLWHKLVCAVFPERCPFCNEVILPGAFACDDCIKKFPETDYVTHAAGGYICASRFLYNSSFKNGVINLKFKSGKQHVFQIAGFMYEEIKRQYGDMYFDFITCVPMHEKDKAKRGFNQTELLAKRLSEYTGIPFFEALKKTVITKPQHTLDRKSRATNLNGAYKVVDKNAVEGKTILICDDLITTGATLGECCKTLEEAGAKDIFGITLCKAEHINLEKL